jgi:isoleucyl-tRNA synthetase
MADNNGSEKKVSYRDSLNLPRTDFPIRPNAKEDDAAMLIRWENEDLYRKTFYHNEGKDRFIFHDGPPYANGHIHLGSAYNKLLKDIACKSRRMMGMQVPVTPGWDCHGLPIELKVTQEKPDLSKPQLIQACRDYAKYWIDVQRKEFKNLGVLMNWDYPYLTMNFEYEAKELRALGIFVDRGYINRSNKTVPWCASCQTVLATAEIEYADRKDPSIYVLFPLTNEAQQTLFPEIEGEVDVVAWTTTPWTLALNRAVLYKPNTEYVLLDVNGKKVLIGKNLADGLVKQLEVDKKVVREISSSEFANLSLQHPFIANLTVPLLADESVLTDEGTAFVHCAPGAGPQDYETGIRNNLEIFSPVGPSGTYDDSIQPEELAGMSVADGQIWAIKKLAELDRLLYKTSIRHSYPHCWRCRKGLIFRATKQWFFDLSKDNLKQRVLQATEHIDTLPAKSINRLQATVGGRLEWCISRQRTWGVPIPALICTACDHTYINKSFIDKVAEGVAHEGIEYWNEVSITTLVGEDFACPSCGGNSFTKEEDILDVWFDSGLSHYTVLLDNPELGYPADLYLEGKDQHRGWFQSSLLTSMALEGEAAMKMIITHGFTVDSKGVKMSKSLGNVVVPQELIDKMGTDGLRLWASSIDFSSEAVVSDILIRNVQEVFRKVRNTCRFLLSNLYDFDIDIDGLAIEDMRVIDQHALQELFEFNASILASYEAYDFTAIFHAFGDYCSVNLSTFYLEIVKDCLYVEKPDSHARRSVQTACWYILDTLTRLMAPIFSFSAEQLSDLYQKNKTESIHLQNFSLLKPVGEFIANQRNMTITDWHHQRAEGYGGYKALAALQENVFTAEQDTLWNTLKAMRSAVLKATETLREKGEIKRSLDAKVVACIDSLDKNMQPVMQFVDRLVSKGESPESFFKDFAIVSQFVLVDDKEGLTESSVPGFYLKVTKAEGVKCPRCWQWSQTNNDQGLCHRCAQLV